MRLQKLILSGFKSFADRTEFVFDEGVTCVVGPNGCGKSNVVDAIRWVLGEQSAKSLRGSEMSDVIFNGTTTRRGAGCAEVVLVFENSQGLLHIEGRAETSQDGLVSVGRRLYRSGASEYLINKTPSRLKDIREMFMDTGIGVDAYSIIEQGRVEVFLQGSQEDRRAIFDEAAGISKYKARKKEALRKLEHVEQDLLRLTDILGEVEKRLRSIKYQAARARSYQEHSQKLRELRTVSMLSQYHRHSLQRTDLQRQVDAAKDAHAGIQSRIDQLEAAATASEVELLDLEAASRTLQARIAAVGGQLTTREERIELLSRNVEELQQQVLQAAGRGEELEAKIATLHEERDRRVQEQADVEAREKELAGLCEAARREHAEAESRLAGLQERLEDEKAGVIELMRRTSELHNEIHAHGMRRESLHGQKTRLDGRAGEMAESLAVLVGDRAAAEAKRQEIERVLADSTASLDRTRQEAKAVDARAHGLQEELAASRERRAGLASRMEALRELQQRHEGAGQAVRRILSACQEGRLPAIAGMLGDFLQTDREHASLVEAALGEADQLLIARELADALGVAPQLSELLGGQGAVEILSLDCLMPQPAPKSAGPAVVPNEELGSICGTDDQLPITNYELPVTDLAPSPDSPASIESPPAGEWRNECETEIPQIDGAVWGCRPVLSPTARPSDPEATAPLPADEGRQDAGCHGCEAPVPSAKGEASATGDSHGCCAPVAPGEPPVPAGLTPVLDFVHCDAWVAPAARHLLTRTYVTEALADASAALAAAPGYRFVTRGGDVLEADGCIRLGAARHAAGVIARQSELASLQEEVIRLDAAIEELQGQLASAQQEFRHLDEIQQQLRTSVYEATAERLESHRRLEAVAQEIARLERERPVIDQDLKNLLVEIEQALQCEARAKEQAADLEGRSAERQRQIDALTAQSAGLREESAARARQLTELQVQIAREQEKKRGIQEAVGSLTRQGQQMETDLAALRAETESCRQKKAKALEAIAIAKEEAERLFIDKTALDREAAELEESRAGLQEKLQAARKELGERRNESQAASDTLAARRTELGEVDVRIENLIARASEEMQLNLLEQFASYQHDDSRDWNALETDIQELRGKIERLGTVNLDAIAEQEELAKRQEFLTTQLGDIRTSRDQLHELIRRINRESREMFLKTFTTIRENFQELFRKLFGGGRADVYLLDENDVLESGIEIVARPPGKELRNLSLLSGGEKAMTAVALLFSIFRTRPSPFCVLDEVDAALDEANNHRFNRLIQEFMGQSQFLIISHSKRTMSMASVLYGVTMPEPGVSRRMAVRFEDVGHKLPAEAVPVSA